MHAAAGGRDSEEREGSQERLQGDGDADGNGASSAEDGAPGGEGGAEDKDAKPQGGGLRMWRAARDRAAWKADVLHVSSHHPAPCPNVWQAPALRFFTPALPAWDSDVCLTVEARMTMF